jgi:hypothetical protein
MRPLLRAAVIGAALAGALAAASAAVAQFAPPSTVFGSVTDQAGPVPADVPIEAYIGDLLCGKGKTEFVGDGTARVTVYAVNVSSKEDKAGCGSDGANVKIKVGDRTSSGVAKWKAGPVQLDVTFGNVTPAAIPTFTPAPTRTPTPPAPGTPAPGATGTAEVAGTIPKGSPGAGSPVALKGGVTSSRQGPGQASTGDEGGFPLWAVAIIVLAGIAIVGGGVGFAMSRSHRSDDDDFLRPPPGSP